MLSRRSTILIIIAVVLTAVGWAQSRSDTSTVAQMERTVWDKLTVRGRKVPPDKKLIFLAIDSESVGLDGDADLKELFGIQDTTTPEAKALRIMSKGWPWSRDVHALVLDRLMGAGAKTVVFDLNFPTPSDSDDALHAALERYKDRVVIGSNFVASSREGHVGLGASLTMPAPTLIPPSAQPDDRVGFVNFWPDPDGVIRRAQFSMHFGQFLGIAPISGEPSYSSLAAQAARKFVGPELIPADLESHAFRFTAPPDQGFAPRSIFEIFVPEYWQRNYRSGKIFDGALVVVGAAGNWQHDEHLTPFGIMAGPEIQLNVINALLRREFIQPVTWQTSLVIWTLAGAIAAGCGIGFTSPIVRMGMLSLVGLGWGALQLPLFNTAGIVAPVFGPLFVIAGTGLFSLVYDLVRAGAEQLRLRLDLLERKRAQEILEITNVELERRVGERTAELTDANARLTDLVNEKTVLLKEVHHRVKNNLQIISSLLNLQAGYIEDPKALVIFNESRNRVRSMALIHEKLYQSQDIAQIDFQDYLQSLTLGLKSSFNGTSSRVRMSVDVDSVMLSVDSAVPCGLIVNELVTNCFKYAFPEQPGEINISLKRIPEARLQLTVSDNGVGLPEGIDIRNTESLGMQLVTTLTDQLDGTVSVANGTGTTFEISFPEPTAKS